MLPRQESFQPTTKELLFAPACWGRVSPAQVTIEMRHSAELIAVYRGLFADVGISVPQRTLQHIQVNASGSVQGTLVAEPADMPIRTLKSGRKRAEAGCLPKHS